MKIYQYDYAGLFTSSGQADESPLEPGVFLMPSNTTDIAPPESWSENQWPRWNGSAWDLITKPTQTIEKTAEQKLAEFLNHNPDVVALIKL